MKRLCVFAHWDKDNVIDDYVLYYLDALKKVCDTIIFVSDCDLPLHETNKLKGLCEHFIAKKHGEYDFGSYKRGFLFAEEKLYNYDELVFANDSVYGPFYPLNTIFEKMDKKKCDFWGMTKNNYGIQSENAIDKPVWKPHIQSYFLVFKKQVFKSEIFTNFINRIKREEKKNDIIKNYEIGLSQILYQNKFKSEVFIKKYKFVHNCTAAKWKTLIEKDKYPFIKTTIVKNGFYFTGEVKNWREVIKAHSDYPIELIEKNSSRLSELHENRYEKFNIYRKIRYNLLFASPLELRYCVILFEKYTYKILNMLCFNKLKKF